jgi:hypothetical protein
VILLRLPIREFSTGNIDWLRLLIVDRRSDIRARWNAKKGDLTKDWKKRHREALKLRQVRTGKVRADLGKGI